MLIFFILLALVVLSIYLLVKFDNCYTSLELVGSILSIITLLVFGIWLIIHVFGWAFASYNYEMFVTKRTAFSETLNESRANGNPIETAAIVSQVSEWNTKLAEKKLDNKTFLFSDYVDDRMEYLEPIK